jgi:hypothetical protein
LRCHGHSAVENVGTGESVRLRIHGVTGRVIVDVDRGAQWCLRLQLRNRDLATVSAQANH